LFQCKWPCEPWQQRKVVGNSHLSRRRVGRGGETVCSEMDSSPRPDELSSKKTGERKSEAALRR
jgi:hypothetical protein